MADQDLRSLERAWQESGSAEDCEAYFRARIRHQGWEMQRVVEDVLVLKELVASLLSASGSAVRYLPGVTKPSTACLLGYLTGEPGPLEDLLSQTPPPLDESVAAVVADIDAAIVRVPDRNFEASTVGQGLADGFHADWEEAVDLGYDELAENITQAASRVSNSDIGPLTQLTLLRQLRDYRLELVRRRANSA